MPKGINSEKELDKQVISIIKCEGSYKCLDYELVNLGTHLEVDKKLNDNVNITLTMEETKKHIIKITIPINQLKIDLLKSNSKLCYNIFLLEHVFEDAWETIGRASEEEYRGYIIEV